MNIHIKNIIENGDKNLSLFENIMIYIKKNEEKFDIFDIAEIIKEDKTFYNVLYNECVNKKMLKNKPDIFIKLSDVFEGGEND